MSQKLSPVEYKTFYNEPHQPVVRVYDKHAHWYFHPPQKKLYWAIVRFSDKLDIIFIYNDRATRNSRMAGVKDRMKGLGFRARVMSCGSVLSQHKPGTM